MSFYHKTETVTSLKVTKKGSFLVTQKQEKMEKYTSLTCALMQFLKKQKRALKRLGWQSKRQEHPQRKGDI